MSGAVGVLVAYADGTDSARTPPAAVAAAGGFVGGDVRVLLGWTPEDRPWLASPRLAGRTVLAGYALAPAVADGRLHYLPVRLSTLPRLVAGDLRPDVAVVTGVRRGSDLVFGSTVGWGPAVARAAERVVVEIDEDGLDLGGPVIEGNIVATVARPVSSGPGPVPRPPDAVDREIGRTVASLLPRECTLQVGPGGVADAILDSLDQPVHIWSGILSDAIAQLYRRGLIVGEVTGAYVWGREVAELAAAGRLRVRPLEETHDLTVISSIDRFAACNTALQVGLDGSVNVERVGGRYVAGVGGHADFCSAAVRSHGGLSIIALRATTRGGTSTIVPQVEVTSTPRCDVELVVTEHGIADLRGLDDAERIQRMIGVAAPQHRAWLSVSASANTSTSASALVTHPTPT